MTDVRSLRGMAIARIRWLSGAAKSRLYFLLGDSDLSRIGRAEAEAMIGRPIEPRNWAPAEWAALAAKDAATLERMGGEAYCYFDAAYPAILRETSRPPFILYARGRMPCQDRPALAVVGTRYPTGRGLEAAAALAEGAAKAGIQVISGLARGIDAAAHRGAVAGGGATFAVLGQGIDSVYPAANRGLAARMLERGGGLISEYPPGTPPSRWTFPERNRIIAGLCRSLVVVEAPGGSGALISASFALEEGRDVYVSEACVGGPRSAGSDSLAADGAQTLASFDDIIADWRGASFRPDARRRAPRARMRPGRRAALTARHRIERSTIHMNGGM